MTTTTTTAAAPRPVILKFGGTSVATAARWKNILAQAQARAAEGLRPVIVCSAITKMTDTLEKLVNEAVTGTDAWKPVMQALRSRHKALADELGVDVDVVVGADLSEIERLATGASLLRERSPRLMARVMAMGELMSTRLGAAFFNKEGFTTTWIDARTCFTARADDRRPEAQQVLSADVDDDKDPALMARFDQVFSSASCVVTQGFIAADRSGGTVLLGRGGSDTSASLFAAKLQALRTEIWTDVPGIFTADPRLLPLAMLVKQVSYGEAQEIASMGAKVLHPRAIAPCRRHRIPMEVRWTDRPDSERTVILGGEKTGEGQVKAITHKRGVTLVSMETSGMWQQVGFLADVFACFKQRGLSIDLVSTSEMNVTVTLDAAANTLDETTLAALVAELSRYCKVRIVPGCATVSLVGRRIRAILHALAPALQVFEEHKVHLVSQAASDLNLTFVVDEEHAERLVRELHVLLFATKRSEQTFGPTWRALFEEQQPSSTTAHVPSWWKVRRAALLEEAKKGTPRYVLDEETLHESLQALKSMKAVDRVFYALKANPNPLVLKAVASFGFGFECVSPGELNQAFDVVKDLDPARVLFTPNFVDEREYIDGLARGVFVTVDNLHPLEKHGAAFAGKSILLRIDPGQGAGHHKYVHTGGASSKFGIPKSDLEKARALVDKHKIKVVGLHAHIGSGILDADNWTGVGTSLLQARELFPDVRFVDVGGGLGVPEKPGQGPLDLRAVDDGLLQLKSATASGIEVWLEPGRFVVARAGVLLLSVTQLKTKGPTTFVGVDGGMNALIRPALYGAYHEIVNLSRLDDKATTTATIVGPICESGDVLGHARKIPRPVEGDVLLVGTTGAYGRSMASTYNLRPIPDEVLMPRR
ncbi:MAG: bifunctional aspartate kinase/diaminopimelate decarboxylase [Deltaproteobacteria bacterium]|nr:bifunctional aspartate kinase/diaminopimelate decarboxylase [Deltaproteobacteria bacterium]